MSNESKKINVQVTNKWVGDFAVIYSIKSLDFEDKDILVFYSTKHDPKFKHMYKTTIDEINKTNFYKNRLFNDWDDIPNDMAMAITW